MAHAVADDQAKKTVDLSDHWCQCNEIAVQNRRMMRPSEELTFGASYHSSKRANLLVNAMI